VAARVGAPGQWAPFAKEKNMKAMKKLFVNLAKDEQGGEVLEYALVAGLIVVAAIATIALIGPKIQTKWSGVNTGLDN
jgi:Flp pilus assembly pilin Flp